MKKSSRNWIYAVSATRSTNIIIVISEKVNSTKEKKASIKKSPRDINKMKKEYAYEY